ncbi:hypothetical protein ACYSNW_02435 [Enterococcus sp. LJL99]
MPKDELILKKLLNILLDAECENLIVDRNEDVTEQFSEKKIVNKVALHEIKYLMNRVGTYNNYDKDELNSILS